jgi:nonsense-mediated mRNA decay protein 3
MFEQQTLPTILCCICGTHIPSNPSNMCVNCIRGQIDITEGIPKQVTIHWCRKCGRYLSPPNHWLVCALESRELLTFCVKKIKGLTKVKLVDAGFVWTEPHSRRLKVKLTVQKEVFAATILQQVFVVEFIVHSQQCDKCQRVEAKDTWNAVVQARQKAIHKRTFYYLEQLILKNNAHANTINIKDQTDGLDFFFQTRSSALKFIDFLQAVAPIRFKTSEHLVSHDEHSNTYNYKYSFSVEIVPICREDLVCLPARVANGLGFHSPIVLITKISSLVHMVDPFSLLVAEMNAVAFWKAPFRAISSASQLIEYTVIDVIPSGKTRGRWMLAEVELARSSDFGSNNNTFRTFSHLGSLLHPGDLALGYDLNTSNVNEDDLVALKGKSLPDVVLVKKVFPNRKSRSKKRKFVIKRLEKEEEGGRKGTEQKEQKEFDEFINDLEEDAEYRSNVLLYKNPLAQPDTESMADAEEDDPDFPDVTLDELIDDVAEMAIQEEDMEEN